MAYTGSNAFSGAGSALAINTGTTAIPVFTTINEVISADLSGRTAKTATTTNFSSGKVEEFIACIVSSGDIKLKLNYIAADAGQIALSAAFSALAKTMFTLTLPPGPLQSSGDVYAFSAVVADYSLSVDVEKQLTIDSSLKISGALVLTPGAASV